MDNDGSGTVDIAELERYLEVINLNNSFRPEVKQVMFEMLDADQSNSFDYKEFARVMSAGDVFKMDKVKEVFDGYEAKIQERKERELKARTHEAALVGMTLEEYEAYWDDVPEHAKKGFAQMTSAEMAARPRDRWGKGIKGPYQNFAT